MLSSCNVHLTPEQAMSPRRGVEVYLYSFFNLGSRCRWVVNATPQPLVPTVQEAGWASGPVWTVVENFASFGIRSPDPPARRQSQLCIYRVKLYDTVDVRHKKCTPYMLPKLQIFKIHTHPCFNESKCYSVGTYTLKGQGCETSTTK